MAAEGILKWGSHGGPRPENRVAEGAKAKGSGVWGRGVPSLLEEEVWTGGMTCSAPTQKILNFSISKCVFWCILWRYKFDILVPTKAVKIIH